MTTTPSERLRKILNERLPELLELSFGCEILQKTVKKPEWEVSKYVNWRWVGLCFSNSRTIDSVEILEILWHTPQWSHVLRSLGDDYAIDGKGNIWKYVKEYKAWLSHSFEDATEFPVLDLTKLPCDQDPDKIEEIIKLFN